MRQLADWFVDNQRDLPWRGPSRDPWGVLVSETMLQQTQVDRVIPTWCEWMQRWPTPGDLAGSSPAAVLRAWGCLGYPRRALRLHQASKTIRDRHDDRVPDDFEALVALPGVGEYTASAVLAFAFRRRQSVLDTNVRRVLARWDAGTAAPATPAITRADRARADRLLPADPERAATASEAWMELGAVVCRARAPRCGECPIADSCAWRRAGWPSTPDTARRHQPQFAGSDRQVRGRIMQLLRESAGPVPQQQIESVWPDRGQLHRARKSLAADGLIELRDDHIALPGCKDR